MTKGQRIKDKRESMQLSQTELAAKVGISKQTLYKYEHDIVTNIPSDTVEKLSFYLECSPAYIMGWEHKSKRLADYLEKFSQLSPEKFQMVCDFIDFTSSKKEDTQ